jgi:hypothetical protein
MTEDRGAFKTKIPQRVARYDQFVKGSNARFFAGFGPFRLSTENVPADRLKSYSRAAAAK